MAEKRRTKPPIKIDYEKVEALAGRGLTKSNICLCLGVSEQWLYNRQKDDKKFKEAILRGEAQAIAAVTGELFKHIKASNLKAIMFFLQCKANWKKTNVVETKDVLPTPEEFATAQDAEKAYFDAIRG